MGLRQYLFQVTRTTFALNATVMPDNSLERDKKSISYDRHYQGSNLGYGNSQQSIIKIPCASHYTIAP